MTTTTVRAHRRRVGKKAGGSPPPRVAVDSSKPFFESWPDTGGRGFLAAIAGRILRGVRK